MDKNSVKKKVNAELKKTKTKKGVYTFISKSEDYVVVNQEIMNYLTKSLKQQGIYVTLNKTHCDMVEILEKQGIDTKKILFIDNNEEGEGCGANNCIFLGKNKSLTALSLAMSKAAKQKQLNFVFFDSITTLLIYNKLESAERFVHFFINKIKNLDILMIIMSIEEGRTNKLIPLLSQFCDGMIRI